MRYGLDTFAPETAPATPAAAVSVSDEELEPRDEEGGELATVWPAWPKPCPTKAACSSLVRKYSTSDMATDPVAVWVLGGAAAVPSDAADATDAADADAVTAPSVGASSPAGPVPPFLWLCCTCQGHDDASKKKKNKRV